METIAVLPVPTAMDPEAACAPIAGEASLLRALGAVLPWVDASRIVVAVAAPFCAAAAEAVAGTGVVVTAVDPESEWRDVVRVALESLAEQSFSAVLVHDWRHPLAPAEVTGRVVAALAEGHRVVVPAIAMTDSVKEIDADGGVIATVDRTTLRTAQYPRGFAAGTLAELLTRNPDPVAAAVDAGQPVTFVDGHADAGRFALPADAALLAAIITGRR